MLGGPIVYNEYTIDNELAKDQSKKAVIAMCVSAAVTCAFLLLRFGPGFSSSGLLSMASTAIFTVMCFAMGQWEVNLPTVSALLTAFSYAINDCVVVFDRIRFEASARWRCGGCAHGGCARQQTAEQAALGAAPAACCIDPGRTLTPLPRCVRRGCPGVQVAKEVEDGGTVDNAAALKSVVNRAMSLVTIRSLLTLETVMVCSLMIVIMGGASLHSFSLAVTFGLLNAVSGEPTPRNVACLRT